VALSHSGERRFVQLPSAAIEALHLKGWRFYTFIGDGGARLMCAWDTTEESVRAFAADIRIALSVHQPAPTAA
jgi:threonine aldolase